MSARRRLTRQQKRQCIFALLLVVGIWHFRWLLWSRSLPEFHRLEKLMNGNYGSQSAKPIPYVSSSVDWAALVTNHRPSIFKEPLPRRRGPLPIIQHRFKRESAGDRALRTARLVEVKTLFEKNWNSYKKFAWMKDVLLPISGGHKNQFSGWGATLVDSLDTLWIMGLREEFDEAVAATAKIDFGYSTSSRVNIFETNIRYLGGLLAAYDLSGREALLKKAVELGDLIFAGFNTENGMPVDFIDFDAARAGQRLNIEYSVATASPGTLSLELTRLSQLTGNPKYFNAISRVMDVFYEGQNATKLPGVWPIDVSMRTQNVVNGLRFTMGASADSLYEYLPKMHQLLGGGDIKYESMSKAALQTIDKYFLFRPMLPNNEDILLPGNINVHNEQPNLDPESEHLTCFLGGMFSLSGKLFDESDTLDVGAKLTKGCAYAYQAFPTGMMPERINTVPCGSRIQCPWNETMLQQEIAKRPEYKPHLPKGFTTAKDGRYLLRPEAIESVFYLYRITGRSEYQEISWDMFQAIRKGTWTVHANAAVLDVTKAEYPLPQEDYMESFWLAETLKYFYLIFSPPDIISLDQFVLNTEAHPFRIPV